MTDPSSACTLTNGDRARRDVDLRRLHTRCLERRELTDGYSFRFPRGRRTESELLEFIDFEARCCPLFTFELVFEAAGGPLWLTLRGPAEVKRFLDATLDDLEGYRP